jgi:hypothetical protein
MVEAEMNMNHVSRYPNFNNPPYGGRPVLAMYSRTPLGELIWLAIPLVVMALALLVR